MEKNLEYGLMVLVALLVIWAVYYFGFRNKNKKCKTASDCSGGAPCIKGRCGHSTGYGS